MAEFIMCIFYSYDNNKLLCKCGEDIISGQGQRPIYIYCKTFVYNLGTMVWTRLQPYTKRNFVKER